MTADACRARIRRADLCQDGVRSLCTATPKGIRWRDERSWLLLEDVKWPESNAEVVDDVVLTGVVRGKGLKADRIVHVPGWGDFQVDSITAAPLLSTKNKKGDAMNVDENESTQVLDAPTEDRDDMATVAPEEIEMEDLRRCIRIESLHRELDTIFQPRT